jgi:hypothetical protein
MTASEYAAVLTKIDAVGLENRADIRALTRELFLTRESLAGCQARCWVQASARAQWKGFAANFLAAAFGATVAFALNHALR